MANLDMQAMATASIEKGMAGSFLQSKAVQVLKGLVNQMQVFSSDDMDTVASFSSGDAQHALQLSQILASRRRCIVK